MNMKIVFALSLAALASLPVSAMESDIDEWVNEGRWPRGPKAVENTPEKQMAKASRLEKIGDTRQAADQYRRLADVYCEADEAEKGLIFSARNYLKAGDFTNCRKQLDELRRRYAGPTYLDDIGEVEINIARGYLEGKGEGGTYTLPSRLRKAKVIFQREFDQDPQGRWADDALFGLGQCAQVMLDYDTAIKKYKELLEKYPRSELRAEAEGNIAICINKRQPKPDYTESETEEAKNRIRIAKDEAASEDTDLDVAALVEHEKALSERQARKRFDQAQFYAKNKKYRAAEVYFELIRDRYADTPWADKAKAELEVLRKR